MKKIAIIGASYGQKKICEIANAMGLYTIGFSWEKNAVCKELFSKFYPISVLERDKITKICQECKIDGVISNGSDLTAEVSAYIADKLNLHCNNYSDFIKAKNKYYVRTITNKIDTLHPVKCNLVKDKTDLFYPCVVKPCTGEGGKGVYFIKDESDIKSALKYAKAVNSEIMAEEFIYGKEISVETLSYNNKHVVIQITDKDILGAPHFVEVGHHQPSLLNFELKKQIKNASLKILDVINYKNGAAHIELKVDKNNNIYLIEINLRGGGDEISNKLVQLSTGFDYIKAMVEISLGNFKFPSKINNKNFAGIYFLTAQTKDKLKYFTNPDKSVIECNIKEQDLTESKTNYDRNGYLIYCGNKKLILE